MARWEPRIVGDCFGLLAMKNLSSPIHIDMHVSLASLDWHVIDVFVFEPRHNPEFAAVTVTILLQYRRINIATGDADLLLLNEFFRDSDRVLYAEHRPGQF